MKRALPVFLFAVLIAVFIGWVPNVHAYSNFGSNGTSNNCQLCHSIFGNGPGDAEHDAHAAAANNCSTCHGGFPPQLTNCTQCHGRTQDGGGDNISPGLGRGLRQHHQGAGIAACAGCHSDATGPAGVGEDVPPSFYPGPANLNPCDGSEERFSSTTMSLDNDGDQLYDGADPDCQAPVPAPDISVTDSVAPNNDLDVPFGPVTVGNTSDQTVTVTNAGNDNLVIGTVAQANPLAAPFSIQNDTCSGQTLSPAANCTLTVRFAPNATSPFSDSFDIPSNDPDENPVTVTVDGTGTGVPVPDITVTDSVAPDNDLQVPFGDVKENTSSDQTVTVTNNGTADLTIGTVAFTDNLAAPFSITNDNCSDTILAQSESCTITVRFAPTALGAASDTFDIPSDDPDENPVTVAVNGTGVANIPPTAPELVLPSDGATGLSTSVRFEWNESTDADGDPVTYDLFVCANDNTFATCPDPVNTSPITASASGGKGLAFAASGMGVMFFGVAFVAGIGRRKTVALLLAMAIVAGTLLVACSDDDNGSSSPQGQVSYTQSGLTTGTTYYWKVVANDSQDSTDSTTRSFSTK